MLGSKTGDGRSPTPHPLKGKRFGLILSRALPKRYGAPKEIVVEGPFSEVTGEDLEMSSRLIAVEYVDRRGVGGPMVPLLPAVVGMINGHQVVIHISELGKELR